MHWICRNTADFTEEALQQAYACLSPTRKEHIDRLRKEEDRRRSLVAQLLVQQLLREHYDLSQAQLHRQENGCPYLTGCDLYVSISHCDEMVACAVSDAPVGIDIERIRPTKYPLFHKVCTAQELAYVQPEGDELCQDPDVLRRFFEIWTAKEAYFKKRGTGITDLKSVNVLPLPRQTYYMEDFVLQIL